MAAFINSLGKGAPLLMGTIAATVVRGLVDCYEGTGVLGDALGPGGLRAHTTVLSAKLPDGFKERFWDPARDHTWNLMALGVLAGYAVMALGVCALLDLFPTAMYRFKVQGEKNFMTLREWVYTVAIAVGNLLIFGWFAALPAWWLQRSGVLRGGSAVATLEDAFSLRWAICHFLAHILVIEVWFYSTHRALHWPVLYKRVHKLHHRWKAPTAVACTFAHPIEFCVGNALGVVLGPALTNCHPYSAAFWCAFAMLSTSGSHSGYFLLGAESHDQHHEFFDYNFGVSVFMDELLGTKFEGSAAHSRLLKKQQAQQDAAAHAPPAALKKD